MKIISGHDFYDSGMAWGRDDSVVFVRSGDRRMAERDMHHRLHLPYGICGARLGTEDQKLATWRARDQHRLGGVEVRREGRDTRYEVQHASVVLCGKLYRGILVTTTQPYGAMRELGKRWIWTADGVRAFAAEHGLELDEGRERTTDKWIGGADRRRIDLAVKTLEDWFTPAHLDDRAIEALVTERVTIASMNPTEYPPRDAGDEPLSWRIDQASLAEMDFAKAVDPYTAFQEISMWVGGVLPKPGPAMVEITDDRVKIAKHGFEHPSSFRRAKTG